MKHGHLTEQRKHFVEAYCRLGNVSLVVKYAGYRNERLRQVNEDQNRKH